MPTSASSRPPPISTATAAAFSSPSPSTRASVTASASINIESALPSLNIDNLGKYMLARSGRVYNAEKVEKTVEALTIGVSLQGYAFGQVKPRFDRDETNHLMNITFVIDEGPRVYIERIDIVGNFRTEDNVIRRQFRLAEGDAFNRLLVETARKRLRALGFFKTVDVEPQPGSAPDRVIILVKVEEQPTGELSFGAGYSTSEGVIGDISITERNLMGKGQYVRLGFSGSLDRAQVDFSFTEPYFLDRNLAAGFDLFHKEVDLQRRRIVQPARHRRQYQARLSALRQHADGLALQVRARGDLRRGKQRLARRASKLPASPTSQASAIPSPTTPETYRIRRPAASSPRSRRTWPAWAATSTISDRSPTPAATIPSPTSSPWWGVRRAAPSRGGAARTFA